MGKFAGQSNREPSWVKQERQDGRQIVRFPAGPQPLVLNADLQGLLLFEYIAARPVDPYGAFLLLMFSLDVAPNAFALIPADTLGDDYGMGGKLTVTDNLVPRDFTPRHQPQILSEWLALSQGKGIIH